MIKAGLLHVPFGTGKHAPIAAEDQGRVIVGILEDPAPHKGGIYPLFGPVEYTYEETARVLSRVLGKDVQYKQIDFERVQQDPASRAGRTRAVRTPSSSSTSERSRSITRTASSRAPTTSSRSSAAVRPMTLEAFITKHRKVYE